MADVKEFKKEEKPVKEASLVVRLSKEYSFEGKKIKEVDLSGIEDISAEDLCRVNKEYVRTGGGGVLMGSSTMAGEIMPEITLEYALLIAEECTDLPIEFFKKLRGKDALKLKMVVVAFFYLEE